MNYQQQAAQKKPIAAAILSIIAGVIGLIMSLVAVVGILYAMTLIGGSGYGFGFFGDILAIAVGVAIWILIASILVLVGGTKIYSRPTEHKKWGVIILVFPLWRRANRQCLSVRYPKAIVSRLLRIPGL